MRANVIIGLLDGLNVALLAMGLVLVYKSGRFINFAHAQLGVIGALVLGKLGVDLGLTWWLAFPLAVAVGGGIGALAEVLVIRPLRDRSRVTLLIATIGLSQILIALAIFEWLGPDRSDLAEEGYPLPFRPRFFIDQLPLGGQHVLVVILVPTLSLGLAALLRCTLLGKTIRAAAANPEAAGLAGIDVRKVSTITWALAGCLSAVSAILAAPNQLAFDPEALGPSLLFRALGAAALARFTSLPGAFAAAVGLGVVEGVAVNLTRSGGTALGVVFVTILIGLLVRSASGRGASIAGGDRLEIEERPIVVPAAVAGRFLARRHRESMIVAAVGFGLLAPHLPPFREPADTLVLALTVSFALVGMSVVVLTGWGGQVSLGQFAFLGVGAFTAARLAGDGWSFPVVVAVCGAVGAVTAVLIGLPALRLAGLGLAVTTLGLAVAGPNWLFRQAWFAPPGASLVPAYRVPGFGELTTQRGIYYAGLALLVLAGLALSALRRSAPGRLIVATRDNADQVAALGISPSAVRLTTFAVSGFLAASAGVVWAAARGSVAVTQLSPQQSLVMLSIPVIGGLTSLPGAVLGAVVLYGIPTLTSDLLQSVFSSTVQFQLVLSGVGLILTQISYPAGLAGSVKRDFERLLQRMAREVESAGAEDPTVDVGGDVVRPLLVVRDVEVRFGGIVAVAGVDLDVHPGEIVGLIGSNGAGKTTLVDAICGLVEPSRGSIRIDGTELVGVGPEFRAHNGIGRSFQAARLFPGLTVRETIQVALHRTSRVGFVASLVGAPWVRFTECRTRAEADAIIERFGLVPFADVPTVQLSTGTRRICDLATQVAARPRLLVLDEPTGGVAQREAEQFGPLLRRIVEESGCSVLIIEHDMPLMLGVADRIYCLERGSVIAVGDPAAVRDDPAVIASYLGTDEAAINRSGPTPTERPLAPRTAPARRLRRTAPLSAPSGDRPERTTTSEARR